MLPATLVTFTTFLLKLCNTSPIYNMQPAFITNTVGATTGRNIRNLPCISRRNSNQSGFCMFAIDCLKANGTHLGTCIDGFYFGSCCYIEPVRDITDNTIDTDIIPHREPPFRISSTTMKTTTRSTLVPTKIQSTTVKSNLSTSTIKLTTFSNVTNTQTTSIILINQTTPAPATTTDFQKLQTFQLLDGSTIDEVSTKASITLTTNGSVVISKKPSTVEPVIVWSTKAPDVKKPLPTTLDSKINTTKTTTSQSLLTVHNVTTEKVTTTKSTTPINVTVKPTKVSLTKSTSKPSKPTHKPSRITTSSRRPDITVIKKQTTTKPTKKTGASTKPTKKISTSSLPSKSTAKVTTTTETSSTTQKVAVNQQSKPPVVSYSTTERINATVTTSKRPATSSKNPITSSKGPVATTKSPVSSSKSPITSTKSPVTSSKSPAIVSLVTTPIPNTLSSGNATKTEVDKQNVTTAVPAFGILNVTTEDWVPITTPDGWVLLSNAANNKNDSSTDILTSSPTPSSSSLFTTTPSSATSAIQVIPIEVSSVKINTTVDVTTPSTTMSSTSSVFEVSSSSTLSSVDTLTVNPIQTAEPSHSLPVNMSDFTDVCGRRMYPEARIVGGEKSSFGKWPWQISLRQWRTSTYLHKCGAALLNENWAITAAHCVDNVPPSDLLLRLGEYDLSTESEPYLHQERRVQIVASHPQFDPRTFEYDLALLRFYEPVNFQPNILPVCVPQNDENFVSRTAYVTGWGRLYEDGPLPSILQEVSVPVINNTVCESMYRAAGYIEHIPHIFICAGWRRGGFDSCEGDSGGPMVIQRPDKRFLLAGVISWGIGCAEPNQPGVYTRISEFRDWINQILQF